MLPAGSARGDTPRSGIPAIPRAEAKKKRPRDEPNPTLGTYYQGPLGTEEAQFEDLVRDHRGRAVASVSRE